MPSSVNTSHDLGTPHFGHAWCNSDGVPHSTVQFGASTVLFDRVEDADLAAGACMIAAAEMRKMKPPHVPALAPNDHALIIESAGQGDDVTGRCKCGDLLGDKGPTTNFNHFAGPWSQHIEQLAGAR